jgi:hypothetical protein
MLLALLVPTVVFLLTVYPGVGGRADPTSSAEFQFVGQVLGVPHAPGFPQYVMLNYLWTRLPLAGDLAFRVNLLSVVCSLVAGGFFFALARSVTNSELAAMLSTWAVLLSRTIWTISTEAGVHALNLAYVSAFLFLGYAWFSTRKPAWLVALLLTYGLSFGNDTSMMVLLPALAFLLWRAHPGSFLSLRWALVVVAAITLGASQYGYLLWSAHSGTPYLEALTPDAALGDVAGAMTVTRVAAADILQPGFTPFVLDLMIEAHGQFLLPSLVVAVWGFVALRGREPTLAGFWALAWIAQAVHVSAYGIGDVDWALGAAPVWLISAVFLAVGLGRAIEVRNRLAVGALVGVAAGLMAVGVANFRELRVLESPFDRSRIIEAAGADGVVITHGISNSWDEQVDNYYRFGLGIIETGPLLVSAEALLGAPALYLSDALLYSLGGSSRELLEEVGIETTTELFAGNLASWLRDLQPTTMVAVIATEIDSPAVLREFADALQPLGLGDLLREQAPKHYVGASVKGPVERGIELTHPDDAILLLDEGDQRFRALLPEMRPALRLPWPVELYAGLVREGIQNRLTIGDQIDLARRAQVRVFAIELGAEPSYEVVEFDALSGTALAPHYLVSGTTSPVRSITVVPGEGGATELRRDDGGALADRDADLAAVVVGCRDHRVKTSQAFSASAGTGDWEYLEWALRSVVRGDWVVITARKPAAPEAAVGRILERLGVDSQSWRDVRESLVVMVRPGTAPLRFRVYADAEQVATAEMSCDPQ